MQAISRDHNYSISSILLKSENVGQEREKLKKCEYLDNLKEYFAEIKSIFHTFLRTFFW